jgi:hypothetical protein
MQQRAIVRHELEQLKTREEMQSIIHVYCDPSAFTDEEVLRRRGICKVMAEEYIPLCALLKNFPEAKARLTTASLDGPDAVINCPDGTEFSVQIVTAYTGYDDAIRREILSQGRPSFSTRSRLRNPTTKDVEESQSGFLSTPAARSARVVLGIKCALQKKMENYKPGTDALLICAEVSLSPGMRYDTWGQGALGVIEGAGEIPYRRIYICDNETVYLEYCRTVRVGLD